MRILAWFLLVLLALPAIAREPLGSEFIVNATKRGQQGVASLGGPPVAPVSLSSRFDGGFLVAWNQQGQPAGAEPALPGGVHARLFGADGAPETDEFLVQGGDRTSIDSGMAVDGSFVIVWDGVLGSGNIEGRRYTAAGEPAGAAFTISDGSGCATANYRWPQVSVAADGSFVVTWTCDPGGAILARHYDADGLATGGVLNLTTASGLLATRVDPLLKASGNFWVVYDLPCRIRPDSEIRSAPCAQRFSPTGVPLGDPTPLGPRGALGTVASERPQAAQDPDGRFAVTWIAVRYDEQAQPHRRVTVRSFDPAGQPLSSLAQFPEDETLTGVPRIAMSPDGDVVVVYGRRNGRGLDEINAREFSLDLSTTGPAFLAHENRRFGNERPVVSLDAVGDYVVAFASNRSSGDPNTNVYARRFGKPPPAEVDLLVSIRAFPNLVRPGTRLDYEVEVDKPIDSPEVTGVRVKVDSDGPRLRIRDERDFNCETTGRGGVTCFLESLTSASNFVLALTAPDVPILPPEPVFIRTTARVSADNPDPATDNNHDAEKTRVGSRGLLNFSGEGLFLPTFTATESAGSVAVVVTRVDGNVGPASAIVALRKREEGDLGAQDIDVGYDGRVSWADGESGERQVLVPIHQDQLDEPDESRGLFLTDIQGAKGGPEDAAVIEVIDDDP